MRRDRWLPFKEWGHILESGKHPSTKSSKLWRLTDGQSLACAWFLDNGTHDVLLSDNFLCRIRAAALAVLQIIHILHGRRISFEVEGTPNERLTCKISIFAHSFTNHCLNVRLRIWRLISNYLCIRILKLCCSMADKLFTVLPIDSSCNGSSCIFNGYWDPSPAINRVWEVAIPRHYLAVPVARAAPYFRGDGQVELFQAKHACAKPQWLLVEKCGNGLDVLIPWWRQQNFSVFVCFTCNEVRHNWFVLQSGPMGAILQVYFRITHHCFRVAVSGVGGLIRIELAALVDNERPWNVVTLTRIATTTFPALMV
ncbi:sentrin-specific protease 2 [Striga asiatica]|uniref:Sentrin-specific protease 2 n=1 Tax=Striga asiatica TaxID=4170 RepID=A0A5A7NXK2_STRAF|nr:sentrin-specific protease 2 [Striga asiatica]